MYSCIIMLSLGPLTH